uniref:DH domain-containing protein n=1 Tax=Sexangularia sp. CB-2014 TaxID=1486929 RepID=A0A7S1VAU1_9EUKA
MDFLSIVSTGTVVYLLTRYYYDRTVGVEGERRREGEQPTSRLKVEIETRERAAERELGQQSEMQRKMVELEERMREAVEAREAEAAAARAAVAARDALAADVARMQSEAKRREEEAEVLASFDAAHKDSVSKLAAEKALLAQQVTQLQRDLATAREEATQAEAAARALADAAHTESINKLTTEKATLADQVATLQRALAAAKAEAATTLPATASTVSSELTTSAPAAPTSPGPVRARPTAGLSSRRRTESKLYLTMRSYWAQKWVSGDQSEDQLAKLALAQACVRRWLAVRRYRRARRRARLFRELLATEKSYGNHLHTLVTTFERPLRGAGLVDESTVLAIFSIAEVLCVYADAFCADLSASLNDGELHGDMCIAATVRAALPGWRVYVYYVNAYDRAVQTLVSTRDSDPAFARWLAAAEASVPSHLTLEDHLIMPVQRVPRYLMLLQDIARQTPAEHPDAEALGEVLADVVEIATFVNEARRAHDLMNDLRETLVGWAPLQESTLPRALPPARTASPSATPPTTPPVSSAGSRFAKLRSTTGAKPPVLGRSGNATPSPSMSLSLPGHTSPSTTLGHFLHPCRRLITEGTLGVAGEGGKERRCFLFTDHLLCTKAKGRRSVKVKYAIPLSTDTVGRRASLEEAVGACLSARGISAGSAAAAPVTDEVRRSFPFAISEHIFLARSTDDRDAWLAAVAMAATEAMTLKGGMDRLGVVTTGTEPSAAAAAAAAPAAAPAPTSSPGRTMLHISQAADFEPSSDEEEKSE